MDRFLDAFALAPGKANQEFRAIGDYNAAHSHPVIRLEGDRFFLPIFFNLAKSIYESPLLLDVEGRRLQGNGAK